MEESKKDSFEQKTSSPSLKVTLFNGKGHHAFIHTKSHKLASAIYLITDLVRDTEPLKWKMREKALFLISQNLSLVSGKIDSKKSLSDSISATCLEMISLIEIGKLSGVISDMNFTILRKEFMDLLSFMQSNEGVLFGTKGSILTDEFFQAAAPTVPLEDVLYKGHDSVFNNMSFITTPSFSPSKQATQPPTGVKNTHSNFVIKSKETSHNDREKGGVEMKDKKDDRREAILRIVRKMGEVTINDIAEVISDCSEKTVQRELLALVSEGILKKTGERRWSRYSIN